MKYTMQDVFSWNAAFIRPDDDSHTQNTHTHTHTHTQLNSVQQKEDLENEFFINDIFGRDTHTHTHTHTYIYIYIYYM